jgi:hypothetical protein
VKHRTARYFASFFLFGFLLVAANSTRQSIAYRQTNLACKVPNVAKNVIPGLVNPMRIAFLSGQPLFTFLYCTWIGGQVLYWLFLRHQTHVQGTLYWEAFQLRLGKKLVEEE